MVNKLRKLLVSGFYGIFRLFPLKDTIVLANFSTGKLDGNLKYIYEELVDRGEGERVILFLHRSQGSFNGKIVYLYKMVQAAWYIATSRVFVVDDYFYPLYVIKPRKGTFVLQVWHACGAFKKFGYSVLDKGFGASRDFVDTVQIHSNYDMVLVSAMEVAKYYGEAFRMGTQKMVSVGIPRTDLFFDEPRSKEIIGSLKERYPQTEGKKVALYAPTFRGESRFVATGGFHLDLEGMKEELGKDWVLLVKLHPFALKDFPQGWERDDFVLNLSETEDINELMLWADLLITDYSSVIFEWSLMEKPAVFYAWDLKEYVEERDFYYDYEDFVPGPIAGSTREVIEYMKEEQPDLDPVIRFKDRFFDRADGQATKRVVDILLKRCQGS